MKTPKDMTPAEKEAWRLSRQSHRMDQAKKRPMSTQDELPRMGVDRHGASIHWKRKSKQKDSKEAEDASP